MSALGKACPGAGQVLAMSQVSLPQKEEVVELPLLAARGIACVFVKLAAAQAFDGLALSPRLLEDFLLCVAQGFETQKFTLKSFPLLGEKRFTMESKAQFRGSGASIQLARSAAA